MILSWFNYLQGSLLSQSGNIEKLVSHKNSLNQDSPFVYQTYLVCSGEKVKHATDKPRSASDECTFDIISD